MWGPLPPLLRFHPAVPFTRRCLAAVTLQDGAPHPALIHATPMVRLWHKPDPSFKVPKAVLYIHLQLPGKRAGGQHARRCCSRLQHASAGSSRGELSRCSWQARVVQSAAGRRQEARQRAGAMHYTRLQPTHTPRHMHHAHACAFTTTVHLHLPHAHLQSRMCPPRRRC